MAAVMLWAMPMPHVATRVLTIPWLPRLVEAVLVLALAWVVAGWLTSASTQPVTPAARMRQKEQAAIPSVARIVSVALFGERAKKVEVKKRPAAAVAPVSHLRLRLLGTILAGAHSAAIVRLQSTKKQKLVFVGDAIEAGVVLKSVEPTAVVVDNHGRSERILMEKSALAGAVSVPSRVAGNTRHVPRTVVKKELNNLAKLLAQARAIPHQTNGKPDGFLIQEIVPGSLYARAGLLNGDVIRKVNGRPVLRPEHGIELFQSLQNASSIDLEIVRNGNTRTMHVDLR